MYRLKPLAGKIPYIFSTGLPLIPARYEPAAQKNSLITAGNKGLIETCLTVISLAFSGSE
jgi:hypothetical protein